VLDNLEHLLVAPANADSEVVDLLLQVLRDAPRVRLLVTSREVLGVQEEWIYELRGLPCPTTEDKGYAAGEFAAADLFAQRARQAYAGFSAAAEWPQIARLCRLVEGLPLALGARGGLGAHNPVCGLGRNDRGRFEGHGLWANSYTPSESASTGSSPAEPASRNERAIDSGRP
jgi:hypothetical protein